MSEKRDRPGLNRREVLGTAGGDAITLNGEPKLPLGALWAAHASWLPRFMAQS